MPGGDGPIRPTHTIRHSCVSQRIPITSGAAPSTSPRFPSSRAKPRSAKHKAEGAMRAVATPTTPLWAARLHPAYHPASAPPPRIHL